jgi:tRNA uridine 5-carboxymethylaminomethyl modification enzyme
LVTDERWSVFTRKQLQKDLLTAALVSHKNAQWLRRPESNIGEIEPWIREVLGEAPVRGLLATIETETKYRGYIQQQERQMERLKNSGGRPIPPEFEYQGILGLSREVQQKLNASARHPRPGHSHSRRYSSRNRNPDCY